MPPEFGPNTPHAARNGSVGYAAVRAVRRLEYPALCPSPQLPPSAAHAVDPADGSAVVADFVIIRPALAVEEHGAAKDEGQGRAARRSDRATHFAAAFDRDLLVRGVDVA